MVVIHWYSILPVIFAIVWIVVGWFVLLRLVRIVAHIFAEELARELRRPPADSTPQP